MSQSSRAKFLCEEISRFYPYEGVKVRLCAVQSNQSQTENSLFWNATPSGHIVLNISNPSAVEVFELGAEYYVDFTKVEQPQPQQSACEFGSHD